MRLGKFYSFIVLPFILYLLSVNFLFTPKIYLNIILIIPLIITLIISTIFVKRLIGILFHVTIASLLTVFLIINSTTFPIEITLEKNKDYSNPLLKSHNIESITLSNLIFDKNPVSGRLKNIKSNIILNNVDTIHIKINKPAKYNGLKFLQKSIGKRFYFYTYINDSTYLLSAGDTIRLGLKTLITVRNYIPGEGVGINVNGNYYLIPLNRQMTIDSLKIAINSMYTKETNTIMVIQTKGRRLLLILTFAYMILLLIILVKSNEY